MVISLEHQFNTYENKSGENFLFIGRQSKSSPCADVPVIDIERREGPSPAISRYAAAVVEHRGDFYIVNLGRNPDLIGIGAAGGLEAAAIEGTIALEASALISRAAADYARETGVPAREYFNDRSNISPYIQRLQEDFSSPDVFQRDYVDANLVTRIDPGKAIIFSRHEIGPDQLTRAGMDTKYAGSWGPYIFKVKSTPEPYTPGVEGTVYLAGTDETSVAPAEIPTLPRTLSLDDLERRNAK